MTLFDPSAYGPAFAALLRDAPLSPLGPGRPDAARRPLLAALAGDDAFLPGRVVDRDIANACRAGMWLLFDFLDESHAISQEIHTAEGSYWHGILHRREPDASNAKYWFRKVGDHPVLRALADQAASLGYNYANPFAFVDYCERVRDTDTPEEDLAKKVQQLEWRLLFDHCRRSAGINPAARPGFETAP